MTTTTKIHLEAHITKRTCSTITVELAFTTSETLDDGAFQVQMASDVPDCRKFGTGMVTRKYTDVPTEQVCSFEWLSNSTYEHLTFTVSKTIPCYHPVEAFSLRAVTTENVAFPEYDAKQRYRAGRALISIVRDKPDTFRIDVARYCQYCPSSDSGPLHIHQVDGADCCKRCALIQIGLMPEFCREGANHPRADDYDSDDDDGTCCIDGCYCDKGIEYCCICRDAYCFDHVQDLIVNICPDCRKMPERC